MAVVGGGIVGLAAARELQLRHPSLSIAVLEKEASLAAHQTGHNSGVVHSGVYYSPGSLKARLCVEGNRRAYAYCDARGIPYQKVGKLIVALDDRETLALMRLWQRARANGVEGAQLLTTPEQVREVEPHCAGVAAIRCPSTGVVDWARVARSYADDFQTAGGEVLTQREVVRFHAEDAGENTIAKPAEPVKAADMASEAEGAPRASSSSSVTEAAGDSAGAHDTTILCADGERILARRVVVCAGLHADRLASAAGCSALPRIVPFRGDYLVLNPDKRYLVKGNIYPVPDARYPFLGVHFTPRPDGAMWLGPNAVLAFSREGYAMGDVSLRDLWEALTFEGFRRLAWSNLAFGVDEMWRALYLPAQVARLKRYIPELEVGDVTRGPSGVRAQALDEQGNLVEDFTFSRAPEGAGDGCATQVGHAAHVVTRCRSIDRSFDRLIDYAA